MKAADDRKLWKNRGRAAGGIGAWLLSFAAICVPLSYAKAQIPDAPTGYVTDLAEVLSSGEREALDAKLDAFERETTNQVFVLIAPDLGGRDVFTVTFETASKWGIGQAGKDNGVLIALYMADRKIRIEVGYGLEGSIPDAFAGRIIRSVMVPHMRDGSPYLAIDGAVEEIMGASRGEFDAEYLGTETDEQPEYFNARYIPAWGEGLVFALAIVYGIVSLLYSIFGGITAKFNAETRLFDMAFDVVEFLSDLIATQILVGVLAGLPIGFLIFVLEEFQVHGYGLIIAAPIVVILFFLHSILRGPAGLQKRIREKTENLNAWRKLGRKFDPDQIEELRAYFHSRLQKWRPASFLRTAYEELDAQVDRALKKPHKYFAYQQAYASKEISRILGDAQFWDDARRNFVSDQVEKKLGEYQNDFDQLTAAAQYDADQGQQLTDALTKLRRKPESVFEYSLPAVTAKIVELTDNAALWSRWRMREQYVKTRVNRKEKGLRRQFADLQKIADPDERRAKLNVFYKSEIEPVRSNPGRFFKRPRPARTSRSHSSSSSYSSSSYSYSSSSSSIGASSSSFSSGFSGGGGGGFGGGGASGSW